MSLKESLLNEGMGNNSRRMSTGELSEFSRGSGREGEII